MKMLTIEAAGGNIAVRLPVGAMVIAFVLLLANLAVATLSVTSGSFDLSLGDVWNTLTGTPPTDMAVTIVWEFRIPRLLVAILVGMLLALSGAVLQYVTANPLADPSLVGVSQGAALAVVMAIVVFLGTTGFALPALAFVGGLAAAALIQILTYSRRGDEPLRFILTGIGVAALIGAVISTVLTYGDIDRVMSALTWLAGSLHSVSSSELQWLFVTALVIVELLVVRSGGGRGCCGWAVGFRGPCCPSHRPSAYTRRGRFATCADGADGWLDGVRRRPDRARRVR